MSEPESDSRDDALRRCSLQVPRADQKVPSWKKAYTQGYRTRERILHLRFPYAPGDPVRSWRDRWNWSLRHRDNSPLLDYFHLPLFSKSINNGPVVASPATILFDKIIPNLLQGIHGCALSDSSLCPLVQWGLRKRCCENKAILTLENLRFLEAETRICLFR